MSDREKVIKGLEICYCPPSKCEDCPYYDLPDDQSRAYCCNDMLCLDALALLKEQKAVEPKKIKGYKPPMYTLYEYECEECKTPMMNKQPFCMGCGKSVTWK